MDIHPIYLCNKTGRSFQMLPIRETKWGGEKKIIITKQTTKNRGRGGKPRIIITNTIYRFEELKIHFLVEMHLAPYARGQTNERRQWRQPVTRQTRTSRRCKFSRHPREHGSVA